MSPSFHPKGKSKFTLQASGEQQGLLTTLKPWVWPNQTASAHIYMGKSERTLMDTTTLCLRVVP